jgi:hypothetical protein
MAPLLQFNVSIVSSVNFNEDSKAAVVTAKSGQVDSSSSYWDWSADSSCLSTDDESTKTTDTKSSVLDYWAEDVTVVENRNVLRKLSSEERKCYWDERTSNSTAYSHSYFYGM